MKIFGILAVIFVVLLGAFLFYEGVFYPVTIEEKVVGDYWVVYEGNIGPYEEVGPVMKKIYQNLKTDGIDTKLGFGIYYDDPKKVSKSKLRSEVGVILGKNYYDKIEDLKAKYNLKQLKKRNSLLSKFPYRNVLSYMVGPMKVYPAMEKYSEKNGIDLNKVKDGYGLEIYNTENKEITYIMPIE